MTPALTQTRAAASPSCRGVAARPFRPRLASRTRPAGTASQGAAGMTLIELLVAMVILGILTAVALPQYSSYVMKSRRADAKTALLDLASRQERFFAINNAYTTSAANLGYGAAATFPINVTSGSATYYTLVAPTVTAGSSTVLPTFVATVTPAGTQQKDTQCYTFQVNSAGVKTNLGSGGAVIPGLNCW